MKRRLISAAAAALTTAGILALPSVAQEPPTEPITTFKVKSSVVPNKAGTPRNPQGVKIKASVSVTTTEGFEKPIFKSGYALFPRSGNWNGGRYPKCTKRILDRDGPKGCPKKSRIGFATGTVYADTVITRPRIEIFNGGAKLAFAYVTLYHPTLVQEPIPVHIKKLSHPKWKYKVSLKVPENLQIVAGVPIAARSLKGSVGRGNIIETTSCPKSRRWPYRAVGKFSNGVTYTYDGSSPCRPASAR